jgi:hypothetical protein
MDFHIINSITTKFTITVIIHRCQSFSSHCFFSKASIQRPIPNFIETLFIQVAHCKITSLARQNITINLDPGMIPGNIAGQFFPDSFTYFITQKGLIDVVF